MVAGSRTLNHTFWRWRIVCLNFLFFLCVIACVLFTYFVCVCVCVYTDVCVSLSLLSHARLRCMCTCNRCTFCLCQNFLNSELVQSVKAKLYTAVFSRFSLLPSFPFFL